MSQIKRIVDGFHNIFTGRGNAAKDTRLSTAYYAEHVDLQTCKELYSGHDIAARIVDILPEDALRKGFDFVAQEGDNESDDAEDTKDLQERVEKIWRDEVMEPLQTALCWERAYGGAGLLIVTEDVLRDPTKLATPLPEEGDIEFSHFQPFAADELQPEDIHLHPLKKGYGLPATFKILNVTGGQASAQETTEAFAFFNTLVHHSRVILFPGIRTHNQLSPTGRAGTQWGESIFSRLWPTLRDFGSAWDSTGDIINDFSIAVLKFQELDQLLAEDGGSLFRDRLDALQLGKSTLRLLALNAGSSSTGEGGEDYQRQTTSVTGLPELLDRYAERLSAAAGGMPLSKIFGRAPAGLNSSGESDITQWDDRVVGYQDKHVVPRLRRMTEVILRSESIAVENWDVVPRSLRNPSDKEKAETRKLVAETDKIYIDTAVLSADEVARSRFDGDGYSMETVVDFEDRSALEAELEEKASQAELQNQIALMKAGQSVEAPGQAKSAAPQDTKPNAKPPAKK